jgi:sulfur carrier protein ThiS
MEQAHITFHRQEWSVESGRTLRETLLQIGINPDNVVPLRNRQVITGAAIVQPGDEIKLVNVVAGG